MTFNPNDHLINLKGKKYLQVTHRLVWFREAHPQGSIITETISLDPIVFKATILDNEGRVIGTGHGSANAKPGAVWSGREVEKAETASIGRALATAGFGTQFAEGFDDDDYLADSPVEAPQKPPKQAIPATNGNGKASTPTAATDAPFIEHGTTEETFVVRSMETVKHGNGKRLKFKTESGRTALAFSRELFKERGWIEDDDWTQLGSHALPNAIPVTITHWRHTSDTGEVEGGYWEVTAVGEVVF